jgi:polar amino acid transport system substrate-binding protein
VLGRVGWKAALALLAAGLVAPGCADDDTRPIAEQTFQPVVADTLTVATYLPAPGYWNGPDAEHLDGGFEWAIAEELATRFDLELRVVERPFDEIVAGELDDVDLALAQITVTAERDDVVDFSVPYDREDGGVLIATGEDAITDLRTARERSWVVVAGSVYEEFVDDVVRPDDPPLIVDDNVAASDAATSTPQCWTCRPH